MKPVVVLAALLAATPSLAQEEPAAEFEGLVEVSEVLIDVLATDRKGDVVRGLGPDDFVVVEGGEIVELTGVSFYTTRYDEAKSPDEAAVPAAEATSAAATPEVPSSRYFLFFFHAQSLSSSSLTPRWQADDAGRRAQGWVRDDMYPSDWVAVVGYSRRGKLYVHQDFTQDREALAAAMLVAARGRSPAEPPATEAEWEDVSPTFARGVLHRGLPERPEKKDTRRIYDALRLVAEATRPLVGRKILLLFTLGLGELDVTSRENRPNSRSYRPMLEALNDNNVAVYPIDLTHHSISHTGEQLLRDVAFETGGRYHPHFISFQRRLRRIAEDNSGYYVLSFRTSHPAGESGYRRIRVKAKDDKIRVRTRQGYRYGVQDDDSPGR